MLVDDLVLVEEVDKRSPMLVDDEPQHIEHL